MKHEGHTNIHPTSTCIVNYRFMILKQNTVTTHEKKKKKKTVIQGARSKSSNYILSNVK